MDYEFEVAWKKTLEKAEKVFGQPVDIDAIIFMIGVQELGHGFRKFTKDEKLNVMHIAICRLLEPYNYYELTGLDKDGWPHFETKKQLPELTAYQQDKLMKEAVIDYLSD
jgi:hypothetical protein